MRLWTLHPCYLDARGLVAAWREALLAQKVLQGATRGYQHHPQLERFRSQPKPVEAMAAFLGGLAEEAQRRGYRFDLSKISRRKFHGQMEESRGQLLFEWEHLRAKLRVRSPAVYERFSKIAVPQPHALFRIIPGEIQAWEKAAVRGMNERSPEGHRR